MIPTINPDWPAPPNVHAYTTTRHLGMPSSRAGGEQETLRQNRERLHELLHLPAQPVWLQQVHGTAITLIPNPTLNPTADGAFTRTAQTLCTVATADCLPVLLCNRQGNRVAAIHAGWRGLAAGIVGMAVPLLETSAADIMAWLGPAIGPQAFEVGPEVREQFIELDKDAVHAFVPKGSKHWLADIYALARLQLRQRGVTAIYGGSYCTYTQRDLLLSCRRGDSANMASMIWFE